MPCRFRYLRGRYSGELLVGRWRYYSAHQLRLRSKHGYNCDVVLDDVRFLNLKDPKGAAKRGMACKCVRGVVTGLVGVNGCIPSPFTKKRYRRTEGALMIFNNKFDTRMAFTYVQTFAIAFTTTSRHPIVHPPVKASNRRHRHHHRLRRGPAVLAFFLALFFLCS